MPTLKSTSRSAFRCGISSERSPLHLPPQFLTECVDELTMEQSRFQQYHRALNKYQSNVQAHLAKKVCCTRGP